MLNAILIAWQQIKKIITDNLLILQRHHIFKCQIHIFNCPILGHDDDEIRYTHENFFIVFLQVHHFARFFINLLLKPRKRLLQLIVHAVEIIRQLLDLVTRFDNNGLMKFSLSNSYRAILKPPDRSHNPRSRIVPQPTQQYHREHTSRGGPGQQMIHGSKQLVRGLPCHSMPLSCPQHTGHPVHSIQWSKSKNRCLIPAMTITPRFDPTRPRHCRCSHECSIIDRSPRRKDRTANDNTLGVDEHHMARFSKTRRVNMGLKIIVGIIHTMNDAQHVGFRQIHNWS